MKISIKIRHVLKFVLLCFVLLVAMFSNWRVKSVERQDLSADQPERKAASHTTYAKRHKRREVGCSGRSGCVELSLPGANQFDVLTNAFLC